MKVRPGYLILFLWIVYLNALDLYEALRMSTVPEYEPSSPLVLSLILIISNVFILVASFGAAFRKYVILNLIFWISIVVIDVIAGLLAIYFDIQAGGYGEEDIVPFLLITLMILSVYILAPLRYCQDIKSILQSSKEVKT